MKFTVSVDDLKALMYFLEAGGIQGDSLLEFDPSVVFPGVEIAIREVDEHGRILNSCLTLVSRR